MQCDSGCILAEQLGWLQDVEAWFGGRLFKEEYYSPNEFGKFSVDAEDAARGYCNGGACNSWMWGSVSAEDPKDTTYLGVTQAGTYPVGTAHYPLTTELYKTTYKGIEHIWFVWGR
jgi:hypothetical protein